jgi:membrane glycosyltransferase
MSPPPKVLRDQAFRRRLFLASVVFLLVILAAVPMGRMLSHSGWTMAKAVFLALFIVLLVQVVFSSVVAAVGWWLLERGEETSPLSNAAAAPDTDLPATAIVMPIYNEDVNRVFQGLRFMNQSLQKTGRAGAFDFFILSDTSDTNCWIAEEKAWFELCKETQGFGRFFYRRRRVRLHHKSGNIADFCRRWGAIYRYMIVLDVDSIMTGETFVRLVGLMEERPSAGIIQTSTRPILGQSLFQRIDQFAAFAYRPLFVAGMSLWQLGDATFWGHNAIVRLKPSGEAGSEPRHHRSRVDEAERLRGVADARCGRQLRARTAPPAGQFAARPAVVPRQFAARLVPVRARPEDRQPI